MSSIFQARRPVFPTHGIWVPHTALLSTVELAKRLWLGGREKGRLGLMPKCTLNVWVSPPLAAPLVGCSGGAVTDRGTSQQHEFAPADLLLQYFCYLN